MKADKAPPWAEAWHEWINLAGKGFKTNPGDDAGSPANASASHFAAPYLAFARAVEQQFQGGTDQDFAARFIASLRNAARQDSGEANDFLNVFLAAAPAALLHIFPDARVGQAMHDWLATLSRWATELLVLPTIGPYREWLEILKSIQRAVLNEEQARAVVDEHYRLASRVALLRFAEYLEDDRGAPITSMRALYDAWIDQAEAVYVEQVMTAAFTHDFAAWINAGSALRLATRKLGARFASLLDVPARDEIDALLARQQIMQRELDALRAERAKSVESEVSVAVPPSASVTPTKTSMSSSIPRSARPAARTSTRLVKTPETRQGKPASAAPPKMRKAKVTRGEFDIAHILDTGK